MKLKVSMPSVFQEEVEVPRDETLAELKHKICRKYGLEKDLAILLVNGRHLKEEEKISSIPDPPPTLTLDYPWSRNLILWGVKGQSILKKTTVFIAGAGALGNEVAKNLAMMGVGELIFADHDTIEASNLNRTIFFDKNDLGQPKAEVLAEKIGRTYPRVASRAYSERIENLPTKIFLNSDLIISGLDNLVSRIFLASIARRYLIPMIDGGMIGSQGRVQNYLPPDSPCPICPLPPTDYNEISGLQNPCTPPETDASSHALPALPTLTSLISAIQSQEAVKILLRKEGVEQAIGKPLDGAIIIDLRYNRYSTIPLKKNPKCMVCGKKGIASDTVKRIAVHLKAPSTLRELKKRIRGELGQGIRDLKLFIEDPFLRELKEKDLTIERYTKKNYIHVIFRRGGDRYGEALVILK